jgi:hypothetical protein
MKSFLIKCIAAEIITIILVTLTFIFIKNHLIAGRIAGSFFMALGLLICIKGLTTPEFKRTFTFKFGCLHLLLSVIMIATRLIHPEGNFAEVLILGIIPGQIYHQISSIAYGFLFLSTCYDLYREKIA